MVVILIIIVLVLVLDLDLGGPTPPETNSYIAGHDVVDPETRGRSLRNFVAQQLRRVLGSAEDGMQEERRIV